MFATYSLLGGKGKRTMCAVQPREEGFARNYWFISSGSVLSVLAVLCSIRSLDTVKLPQLQSIALKHSIYKLSSHPV